MTQGTTFFKLTICVLPFFMGCGSSPSPGVQATTKVIVSKEGPGDGLLRASSDGSGTLRTVFFCPAGIRSCEGYFTDAEAQRITITTEPDNQSYLSKWDSSLIFSRVGNSILINAPQGKTSNLTAILSKKYQSSIRVTGSGLGTVYLDGDSNIASCSGICQVQLSSDYVILRPQAGIRSTFVGWSGGCTGTGECRLGTTPVGAEFSNNSPCGIGDWCPVASGTSNDILDIDYSATTAVGRQGTILSRNLASNAWTSIPAVPASVGLNSVFSSSGRGSWIVGSGGTVLKQVGSSWQQIPSGTSADLYSVNEGFGGVIAVGANGTVLQLSPTGQPVQSIKTTVTLHTVSSDSIWGTFIGAEFGLAGYYTVSGFKWLAMPSSVGIFASVPAATSICGTYGAWLIAGQNGRVFCVDGFGNVSNVTTPAFSDLWHIWRAPAPVQDRLWIVGSNGTILRHAHNGWELARNTGIKAWLYSVTNVGTGYDDIWVVGSGGAIYNYAAPFDYVFK